MEENKTNFDKILEALEQDGKKYTITIDTESTGGYVTKEPKVSYVTPFSNISKEIDQFFNVNSGVKSFVQTQPEPAVYDDTEDANNTKIQDKFPMFGYASLLDEVLEEFGGVQEIMKCNWDSVMNEGEVVCLMNDWRVFRYYLKDHEFSSLNHDERKSKINRECMIHEDMDDYGHWLELGGEREEQEKKAMMTKIEVEKAMEYQEKYSDVLKDFFSGGSIEALQKMMQKNSNV